VPKPSHLRSVNPKPAPAVQGAAAGSSGAALEAEPTPLASPASAVPGAASRVGSVSVEMVRKPGRRRFFSASEKQRILGEAAVCLRRGERGAVAALLRREGIYSSALTAWRKQLAIRGGEGLVAHKPGPKPKLDAKDRRIANLEKRAAWLEGKLSLAQKLIDLQKKVSAILGIDLATDGES
jgi:transposase